ncbi:MAG: hypothetical protein LBF75_06570, partial [Treponema sp.]|nr:hypothetical protein [Treponema sp.]
LDLFNNPVGYRTSLAKCSAFCCFLSGSCSETEVSEQLYYKTYLKNSPAAHSRSVCFTAKVVQPAALLSRKISAAF